MLVVVVRIMVLENYSGMVIKCDYIDNKLVVCGDAWWGCCGGGEGLLMYMETRYKKKKTISITQNLDENGLHTNTKIQDFITKYFFLSSLLK